MDKDQADQLIQGTFEDAFDEDKFQAFIRELLNDLEFTSSVYSGSYIKEAYREYISPMNRIGKHQIPDGEEYIKETYREYISSMNRIGKYQTPDGEEIDILVVKLKEGTSLVRARSRQKNYIADYLNSGRNHRKDAALVAFVAPDEEDWRFSLIKMDYAYQETSSARRVSSGCCLLRTGFRFLLARMRVAIRHRVVLRRCCSVIRIPVWLG